jgi:hypothetical protein
MLCQPLIELGFGLDIVDAQLLGRLGQGLEIEDHRLHEANEAAEDGKTKDLVFVANGDMGVLGKADGTVLTADGDGVVLLALHHDAFQHRLTAYGAEATVNFFVFAVTHRSFKFLIDDEMYIQNPL